MGAFSLIVVINLLNRKIMAAPVNDSALFEAENEIERELEQMTTEEILGRTRLIDTEIKIMKSEVMRLNHEISMQKEKITENNDKVTILISMDRKRENVLL